ncbi:MAG: methionyl-tRNA formyltransferase, partial [Pseudomonadales bacterium]
VVTLIDTLLRLETIKPKPQPAATDGYAKKISKAEALIAWSQPAAEIDRQIRAFNPLPVAYSYLGDMRVKFWQAKPMPNTLAEAPGTIVALDKQAVTIACGDGSLAVTGLQLPLGKGSILSSADIINARTKLVHQGLVFGGPPADA